MSRPLNRPMITLSVMLATVMQVLDSTIANVALPHMQGGLSASLDQIAWVLTSYIVAAAIATPLTGWLTDRFGRRRVFLAAVAGFTGASALCGISGSLTQLVLARLLQGVCGAPLVPLSQAIMLDSHPPETRGSAMAVWGVGVMVGPILGPTLGGWLTESYDWRWVFFINVPFGLMAFYGISHFIPTDPPRRAMRFDLFGFATLGLAIGALQMMLDRGNGNDWFGSIETRIELAIFLASLAYFLAHTACTRAERSFIDYRMFKDRNLITGLIFIFIIGLVLYATRALIPPMLQGLMDWPAATVGWLTAPGGAGTMMAMLFIGKLVGRIELKVLLLTGFTITAVSLWQMMGYALNLSEADIIWPGLIQGIGLGLVFVPLSTATFATLDRSLFPQATAMYSLVRNIGSSIGISTVQTLLVRHTQIAHASIAANLSASSPALAASGIDPAKAADLIMLNAEVTRQATMIAYVDCFGFMLVMTLLMMPLLLLIRSRRSQDQLAAVSAEAAH